MKRFYQFLTMMFVGLALVACDKADTKKAETATESAQRADVQADLKTDLAAFDQATEQNGNLAQIQTLQSDLQSAKTPEEQADIFNKIAAKYEEIKASIEGLDVKTDDGKALKDKFVSGFSDFIKLMQDSAKYVIEKPTEEQAKALRELQQQATEKLSQAAQSISELKAKVVETK
ncbi:hypothetical protein [Spirabiliibacterium falconis]|uniref:hypothetical protein n=1 Tax=Spirabiliibacterium falconis TaxID=572023 RepID=UPI001AAD94CD|nr:hypothetical protein [Spirabiliibacterium falconis]MBE2894374.1 hypothetical protein [Spirabiliibacterium falconis]